MRKESSGLDTEMCLHRIDIPKLSKNAFKISNDVTTHRAVPARPVQATHHAAAREPKPAPQCPPGPFVISSTWRAACTCIPRDIPVSSVPERAFQKNTSARAKSWNSSTPRTDLTFPMTGSSALPAVKKRRIAPEHLKPSDMAAQAAQEAMPPPESAPRKSTRSSMPE